MARFLKKALKIIVLVGVLAVVVLQFFRIDKSAPPVVASETLEAAVNVPPDVSLILGRACNDCHSNKTVYPWYANIQPVGWFVQDHIVEGREHLNFSRFNTLATDKKERALEEICEEVESGSMPLPSYLWIHSEAVLTDSEKKALCTWTQTETAGLAKPAGTDEEKSDHDDDGHDHDH